MKKLIMELAIVAALVSLIAWYAEKSMGAITKTPATEALYGKHP